MMPTDSPKRTARTAPNTVPPQAVSDRSLLDSVTGYINDITLQNVPQQDSKDVIQWARFETTADVSDVTHGDDWDLEGGVPPPLLLILGYGNGVQVWAVPANGEAVEVLSWRHGTVRALRILPKPNEPRSLTEENLATADKFADQRPLMVVSETTAASSGPAFCTANFVSLRNNELAKSIKFKSEIYDILSNRSVIAFTFKERIAVFDANTLEDRLTVTTCFPGVR